MICTKAMAIACLYGCSILFNEMKHYDNRILCVRWLNGSFLNCEYANNNFVWIPERSHSACYVRTSRICVKSINHQLIYNIELNWCNIRAVCAHSEWNVIGSIALAISCWCIIIYNKLCHHSNKLEHLIHSSMRWIFYSFLQYNMVYTRKI